MEENHQYYFERLSTLNMHFLASLYMDVYKKKVTADFFLRKYNTKNFGVEYIGHIAFTKEKFPAAFYGVIPCHFRINNTTILAAQSADTMTHPKHQRKGLFMRLARNTYEVARQEGVQFIFGFPNQNSYSGFVKLNWTFLPQPMQCFAIKGSKFPFAALLLKIPLLKNIYGLYMQLMISEPAIEDLHNDHSGESGVVRNTLFLQYKNQYSKTFVKRWQDVCAWMKNDGILKVGLIRFDRTISSKQVVDRLVHVGKILGCRAIVLMMSPDTELYNLLIRTIKPEEGLQVGFYNLTDCPFNFNSVTFEYCDVDIF